MYTYIELKIICKSKIESLQLSLENIIIVLHSIKCPPVKCSRYWGGGAAALKALSPSVFFDRAL